MAATTESDSVLTGRRFGAYELHEIIGAGGMGEVYRATDSRLHRSVAIKVLPKAWRLDADRVARLDREAQLLAALNHPNIATIHGFEDADGMRGLVLELVEGPTIAAHLEGAPAPVAETVAWARQIAQGLKAAHERAIVHRDLKPANIKLRPDGVIKLLDFGVAKLRPPDVRDTDVAAASTASAAGTHEAVIVGTLAYMSPEQVRGDDVDERTDVWAFGCVLFVMLSGRAPFAGRTPSDLIAAILGRDPDWGTLPSGTPAPLRRILKRCLQKDRRSRLRDLGEALADLEEAMAPVAASPPDVPSAGAQEPTWRSRAAFAAIAVAVTVSAASFWSRSGDVRTPAIRFSILAPAGSHVTPAVPAVSPDGRVLVFSACSRCDTEDLDDWVPYLRSLERPDPVAIPQARGAFLFFFSPDGRSIGFCRRDGLFKVSAAGDGPRTTLYEGLVMGADWAPDDTIVVATQAGLMRISAAGGTPQPLTSPKPGIWHASPAILPGGGGVLFTEWAGAPLTGTGQIAVVSFDGKVERTLLRGSNSRLSPSGHLVFTRDRSLWVVPFDERRLTITGEAAPLPDSPVMLPHMGVAIFTIGRNGTLAFVAGDMPKPARRTLAWVTRDKGEEQSLNVPPAVYGWPRVAPNGAHIALDIVAPDHVSDIWTYDIARGRLSKLTDDPQINLGPVWTPDSQEVVYTTGPPFAFLSKPAGGPLPTRHLVTTSGPGGVAAGDWSPDGRYLVFSYLSEARLGEHPPFDIGIFTTDARDRWKPLLQSDAAELNPDISPTGNWIAYGSNQTGQFEVYIERFPELGTRQMVSKGGGIQPVWAPNGKEIFYRSVDGRRMLAVPFDPRSGVRGDPVKVFEGSYAPYLGGLPFRSYDVTPDGKRFIIVKELPGQTQAAGTSQLNVVLNWSAELKRR
jgi:eukaryotic-like serine/threonine-protein kinase